MTRLPEIEFKLLSALKPGAERSFAELVKETSLDQSLVSAAATMLAQKGFVGVAESSEEAFALVAADSQLPEKHALALLEGAGGTASFAELPKFLGKDDVRAEMKWLTKKGWCRRAAAGLTITAAGKKALTEKAADELLLAHLGSGRTATETELVRAGVDVAAAKQLLKGRDDIVKRKKVVHRSVKLTPEGEKLVAAGIEPAREVTQLTPDMLAAGQWRGFILKRYDVKLDTAKLRPGKPHPLQRAIAETRRAFLEMGFEEAASAVIETAFWNFDALFQPQDHPAREMQDTFYVAKPESGRLPDPALVERVKRAHEDGGDTGSIGWRYKWDQEKARQLVLRTHTTATTIQAVAASPKPPRKVFSCGKVFRRENVDQTHLPEFMQIDGIIIDEDASLVTLFGTLREFYLRMGAKDVIFRPGYFPYTEPSAEVLAFIEGVGWVEMCGSGVFRPEVTKPLGCDVPVIAWGGGLERVAMLRFGLDDIRKLYWADVNWLREARLCR